MNNPSLQELKMKYCGTQCDQTGQLYNQSTIYLYEETKKCIAEFGELKIQQHSKEAIWEIKQLQDQKKLTLCVQIFEIHNQGKEYAIVMELGKCDLEKELENNPNMCFMDKLAIQYQLCCCVENLQDEKIIHSDVKASNFIKFEEQKRTQYKLADFGISQKLNPKCTSKQCTEIAPEVRQNEYNNEVIDNYALGKLFEQMITDKQLLDPLYAEYVEIIQGLQNQDPNKRLKIKQAKHQLSEILNKLKKITLFGLIEITFIEKENKWFLKDNFNNRYDNFEFQFENNTGQTYSNSNKCRNIGDQYKSILYAQPYLFNAVLKTDVRIDQEFENILQWFNKDDQGRSYIKLLFLLSNLFRTIQPIVISQEEMNFCISNSCANIPLLSKKQEYMFKNLQSQILYSFYTPQRLQKTNNVEINLVDLIRKIVQLEYLTDQEIEWLFQQQDIAKLIKINQNICVDQTNKSFIFTKSSAQQNFYKSEPCQISKNIQQQFLNDLNLQSIFSKSNNYPQVERYCGYLALIYEFMQLSSKNYYFTSFENAFIVNKPNIEREIFQIQFLEQFLLEYENPMRFQECKFKLCEFINNLDKGLPKSSLEEQLQQINNYLQEISFQSYSSSTQKPQLKQLSDQTGFVSRGYSSLQILSHNQVLLGVIDRLISQLDQKSQIGPVANQRSNGASLSLISTKTQQITPIQDWLLENNQSQCIKYYLDDDDQLIYQYQSVQVIILKELPSQNTRRCIDIIKNNKFKYCLNIREVFEQQLITELPSGNLLFIIKQPEYQAMYTKLNIMYQMALSLQELHQHKISHQNIKLQYFMEVKEGSQTIYKLSQFSQCIKSNEFNSDIYQLRQIFYQILMNDYTQLTILYNIDNVDKNSLIAKFEKLHHKQAPHLNNLIQLLFNQLPLYEIIKSLKSMLLKSPQLRIYQLFKVQFYGEDLMDNFGNTYYAYKFDYQIIGDYAPTTKFKGELNQIQIDGFIKFEFHNKVNKFKANIVLRLHNLLFQNIAIFKNLQYNQIINIIVSLIAQNAQNVNQDSINIINSIAGQDIRCNTNDYNLSTKRLISQIILLYYNQNSHIITVKGDEKQQTINAIIKKNQGFFNDKK